MKFDISDMKAEVYRKTDKGMYLAKVSFPTIGMYVSGWTVRSSVKDAGELWVQPPAIRVGAGYKRIVEFRNDSEVFGLIKDEILRAVELWNKEQDIVIEDIDDEPITLDDIPF